MEPNGYHLAQVNIGRLKAPIDSPTLAGFVAALNPVNARADAAEGFIWRLQTEAGDATAIRPFDDECIMVNLSVWESLAALRTFVLRPDHRDVMVQRRLWFEAMTEAYVALWWVPTGCLPSVADAKERLAHLRRWGPTDVAFDFRHPRPAPDEAPDLGAGAEGADWSGCPAG